MCACDSRVGLWLLCWPGYPLIGPCASGEEIEFDVWIEISDGPWLMNLSLSMWVKAIHHILGRQKGWIRCWQQAGGCWPRELHYSLMYTCRKSSGGIDRIGTRCRTAGVNDLICVPVLSRPIAFIVLIKKKKKSFLSEFIIDLVFQKVQIDFPAKYLIASFASNDLR